MGLYDHIDNILTLVFQVVDDGTFSRLVQEGPALAWRFWTTDAGIAQGISIAQFAAAIVSALFVFVIAVAVMQKKALAAPKAAEPLVGGGESATQMIPPTGGAMRERWNEVIGHLDSPREAEWKVAVMEADKLVDDALARAGFPGESFGDRLTNIKPDALQALDGLWWAHKVRNRLAHEVDYFLRYTEARQAIGYYEQALAELQLI